MRFHTFLIIQYKRCIKVLQIFDNEFTMMYQSIGPKNEGDALLVENGFVVAALYLQTHNQILPRTVQIHGHQHLISRNRL